MCSPDPSDVLWSLAGIKQAQSRTLKALSFPGMSMIMQESLKLESSLSGANLKYFNLSESTSV